MKIRSKRNKVIIEKKITWEILNEVCEIDEVKGRLSKSLVKPNDEVLFGDNVLANEPVLNLFKKIR